MGWGEPWTGVSFWGYHVRAWWDRSTVDTSVRAGSSLGTGPAKGEQPASTRSPGGKEEEGVYCGCQGSTVQAQPGLLLLLRVYQEAMPYPDSVLLQACIQQHRKNQRPAGYAGSGCVYKERPPTLHPVPCGFVSPGPGGGAAIGDTKQGAGGPFLSPQCRKERPTLRPLVAWCPPSPWPPFMRGSSKPACAQLPTAMGTCD